MMMRRGWGGWGWGGGGVDWDGGLFFGDVGEVGLRGKKKRVFF